MSTKPCGSDTRATIHADDQVHLMAQGALLVPDEATEIGLSL